jgi:L-ascorbate metabolism protein UlaG (beta-lactamase superfamily)
VNTIRIDALTVSSLKKFVNTDEISSEGIEIAWIGQAGFIIRFNRKIYIIDPYLSDSLAEKYKGKEIPYDRLMEIPILPKEFNNVDFVFSTHSHSDHMDSLTITAFSQNFVECRFIVPAAEIEKAIENGINKSQLIPINADQTINLDTRVDVTAIPSAHESFKINERWEHSYLGFILHINGVNIYHSGGCILYKGLIEKIRTIGVDIALLPISGENIQEKEKKVGRNFTVEEVLDLCEGANIKNLIVHHFGMFSHNTVSIDELVYLRNMKSESFRIIIPEINRVYKLMKLEKNHD